jgi:uncharacterized membrane protein
MMRWVMWLAGGLVLGGIVHLTTILLLPRTATQDAYARVELPPPSPGDAAVPLMDPAFAAAVCRYDLSAGPVKLTAPISQAYTSVSFYTRNGISYYAINDRAAGRRTIDLDLMTTKQRSDLPEDEEITAADRLIVESPTNTGLIVIRVLSPEPGMMTNARAALAGARCRQELS